MKNPVKCLIVIAGPTAVGKSALALHLAHLLDTEIISADSRQIYREMDIGTAKPNASELAKITHHFVNELSIQDAFSASLFEEEGLKRLQSIFQTRDVAILCGGTGLYINALCKGLDQIPDVSIQIREHFDQKLAQEGIKVLQELLRNLDPEYAKVVDMANPRRLIRALGVIETTGRPFSSYLQQVAHPRPFHCIYILLTEDRSTLYQRIDQRVDSMIEQGLEKEVQRLLPYKDLQALQTVGYQEWFPYFAGIMDRAEAIRLIKRNSRRYAKRQLTWFRKHNEWQSFPAQDWSLVERYIRDQIKFLSESKKR